MHCNNLSDYVTVGILQKKVFFWALPEKGGGETLPNFLALFQPFFTGYPPLGNPNITLHL